METNLFGLILSSAHEQVGRGKSRGVTGAQRNVLPTAPHTPRVKQGFILYDLWWDGLIHPENCNERLKGRKVCKEKAISFSQTVHPLFPFDGKRNSGIIWSNARGPLSTQSLLPPSV